MTKKQKIAVEKAKKELTRLISERDTEEAHSDADGILCILLREFECKDVIDIYHKIDKWYA